MKWTPRNYYIFKNKTSGKMYVGQTFGSLSKYKGSGVYWKNHCKKHGGYNKENIKETWSHWFEDKELAQLFLDEFEDLYPNYYSYENTEWANEVQETTDDVPTPMKHSHIREKVKVTKSKVGDDGLTGYQRSGKKTKETRILTGSYKSGGEKQSKTLHNIQNDGTTIAQKRAIKMVNTVTMLDDAGVTIAQKRAQKSIGTRNTPSVGGLTPNQIVGMKVSKVKSDPNWKEQYEEERIRKFNETMNEEVEPGVTRLQLKTMKTHQTAKELGSNIGINNGNAKSCYVGDVFYGLFKDAVKASGLSHNTLRKRLNNKTPGFAWASGE